MLVTLIIIAVILFLMGTVIFLRKLQYDQMHQNLLDLVDKYGGEVVRRGFAASPVYNGKFKNKMLVINFSSVREEKNEREFYATFTYEVKISRLFSIMSLEWLEKHPVEQNPDAKTFEVGKFRVSSSQPETLKMFKNKPEILDILQNMDNLVYLFSSVRGVMFEVQIGNMLHGSKIDFLESSLLNAHRFILKVKKG